MYQTSVFLIVNDISKIFRAKNKNSELEVKLMLK